MAKLTHGFRRYDRRGEAQVLDDFVAGLRAHLHFYSESEEQRVLLASCFLEAEARQWWLYLCNGHERLRGIDDVASFVQALLGRFMPRSAKEQALGELRKLKKGKLSRDRYIEKYQSLVQKSHNVDPELQYQWLIAGLTPEERQSARAWPADRELKAEVVGLGTMVQFLRIKERRNATATALAEKGELLGGGSALTQYEQKGMHGLLEQRWLDTATHGAALCVAG